MIRRIILLAFALLLLPPVAADAADTTVTFSGLADGTEIRDQYAAQGVLFGDASAFGFGEIFGGCTPAAPSAAAGTAALGFCGGSPEFPHFASSGAFSSFRSKVSMKVFTGDGLAGFGEAITLRVYDVHRVQITSAEVPLTAAPQTLTITLATPQIAFFSVERNGQHGPAPRIDDFTFDNPPVPPDPQIAIGVAGNGLARLRQGGSTDVTVRILRFNGSNGNVNLSVGGLPFGVPTATFTPNPAGGSSFLTTAALHLAADNSADTGHSTPTITANPAASAGSTPDSASFALDVVPPFRLAVQPTARVAPCTPTSVPLTLDVEQGYTDPITLTVTHSSGTVDAPLPATFTPGFSAPITSLPLQAAPGTGKAADDRLTIEARSGAFTRTAIVAVDRYPGSIDAIKLATIADIDAGPVVAPRLGQPGTYLRVLGTGLCGDSRIFFGAGDSQGAPLESRSADGRTALVRVPFTAVNGQPTLTNPDSDGRSAGAVRFARALTIATYRDTFGFSFANFKSDGPNWGDIVRLYGKAKTTIEVDPCGALTFGIADCGISTGIPRPEVAIYYNQVDDYGENGNCYGLDLASYRLWSGRMGIAGFPPAGSTWPFQLDGPAGPAGELRTYVRQMMLAQSASEVMLIRAAVVGRQTPATMFQAIQGALAKGHPAMMSIRSGDSGHAILAYGLTPTAKGYDIETYNPNSPHMADEDGASATHDARLENSRVHVDASGTWSFPGLKWSGGFDKIGAYDVDLVPSTLSPPTGLSDFLIAITHPDATAIDEVTDPAGKPLAGATRLAAETGDGPGPLTDVIPRGRAVRATLKGHGGTMALFGGTRAFEVAGSAKALTVDRADQVLGLQAAARGTALSATDASAGGTRAATATLAGGGDAALGFTSASTLTLRASGTVALTLGQVARRATGTITLGGLRLRAGETATIRPASWTTPGRVAVTVRRARGAARRLTLRSRTSRRGASAVRSLRLRTTGSRVAVTARLRLPAGAPATATLAWQARRGARTVRRGRVALAAAQLADLAAGRSVGFLVGAPKGTYTVRVTLVVAAVGGRAVLPSVAARRATVRVAVG